MNSKKTSEKPKSTAGSEKTASRIMRILPLLRKAYPNAATALHYSNPLELLIATILSAQCTDKQVNLVTPKLFAKYKSASDWANAPRSRIETDIRSTGFFRNKAESIKSACAMLAQRHGGKIPATMEELTRLPGVGRKTASVVLGNAFGVPAIACDTHVIRLSRRLGLSANRDPVKLEFDLAEIIPKRSWTVFSHLLVLHGRNVCKARKPDCDRCVISSLCPAAGRPELW